MSTPPDDISAKGGRDDAAGNAPAETGPETAGLMAPPGSDLPDPYQGLVPYREADAEFFFGRNRETKIISSNLASARFTLLYGPSGVGKTSALRAGVARELRLQARRNTETIGMPEFAVGWLSHWRSPALPELEQAIRLGVADAVGGDGGPVEGATPLDRLEAWCDRLSGEIFLILDQFEEYFLYHPQDRPGDFADVLTQIVAARELPVNVLVSLRDDALSQMDRFKGRIPGLFSNFLRIDRLDRSAGRLAIDGPVGHWNNVAESQGLDIGMRVEEELREEVLNQVQVGRQAFGEKGRGVADDHALRREEIETPFLQLVMQRLWSEERQAGSDTLRLATFEKLGGASEILRTHLGRVLERLTTAEQEIARKIFYYLVTPSGAKIAHAAGDLASYTGLDEAGIERVLMRLCDRDARILREAGNPDGSDTKRFEIYHDVLGSAILEWQRDNRASAEKRRLLEETQKRIAEQQAIERQRQARIRQAARFNLVLAMLCVLGVGILFSARAADIRGERSATIAKLSTITNSLRDRHFNLIENRRATLHRAAPTRAIPSPAVLPSFQLSTVELLERGLREDIGAGLIEIFSLRGLTFLRLNGGDLFGSGNATLNPGNEELIDRIVAAAERVTGPILVTGHTDSIPVGRTNRYGSNLQLSLARAQTVMELMAERLSDPGRISAEGRGETEPIADNGTREGRALNRRIEIVFKGSI